MKPVYTLFLFVSVAFLFLNYAEGPPAGRTNSPSDGKSCKAAGCHNDAPLITNTTSWITSNIPAKGFIKDSTYTITITPVGPGHSVFGFECAAQEKSGTPIGTLGLLNTTETQFASGSTAYVEQTFTGSRGAGKTWQFSWKAAAATTGDSATFYACVNVANGNGANTGDSIYYNSLTVKRAFATPTSDIATQIKVQVSPNPTSGSTNNTIFRFSKSTSATWNLSLYNMYGALVATHSIEGSGDIQYQLPLHNVSTGLYAYSILDETNTPRATGKLVIGNE